MIDVTDDQAFTDLMTSQIEGARMVASDILMQMEFQDHVPLLSLIASLMITESLLHDAAERLGIPKHEIEEIMSRFALVAGIKNDAEG